MFTLEEATAFLTAEKLISKLTDQSTDESYKSAMYKIKAVLRATEKDHLENMDKHIAVVESPYMPHVKPPANPLQVILKSIAEKNILSIDYFANHSQEQTQRKIEPVGIFYMRTYWHLVAYCHLRKDYRNFRVDRISNMKPTKERFEKEHPELKSFLEKITKEETLYTVVMRMEKDVIRHLGDQKYYNGFISQKEMNDCVEMTFLTHSIEGFARWYMMFGDKAEIVKPPELKKFIRQLSAVISKK